MLSGGRSLPVLPSEPEHQVDAVALRGGIDGVLCDQLVLDRGPNGWVLAALDLDGDVEAAPVGSEVRSPQVGAVAPRVTRLGMEVHSGRQPVPQLAEDGVAARLLGLRCVWPAVLALAPERPPPVGVAALDFLREFSQVFLQQRREVGGVGGGGSLERVADLVRVGMAIALVAAEDPLRVTCSAELVPPGGH